MTADPESFFANQSDPAGRERRVMVRAHGAVTIGRPPPAVFPWIGEPDLAARWQPDVAAWEVTHRPEEMVGTEFREILTGRGGSAEMRGRVVAYRPDELIAFDLDGPAVTVHAEYTVTAAPTGAVVQADVVVAPTRHLPVLVRPLLAWRIRRQLRRELETLRRLCEAEPTHVQDPEGNTIGSLKPDTAA